MKTKINQLLHEEKIDIHELAAICQDIWHYAAVIKPHSTKESAFAGDRIHDGLFGKLLAYEFMAEKIYSLQYECFPAFCELNLPDKHDIQTEVQLIELTGYAINALNLVCQANCIDGYTGCKIVKEDRAQ